MKDQEVYNKLLALDLTHLSLWQAANLVYDNCMQKSQHGNGARISQMRRIGESEKYPRIKYYIDSQNVQYLYFNS